MLEELQEEPKGCAGRRREQPDCEEPVCKQAGVLDRVVELPGAIFQLHRLALTVAGWVANEPSATAGTTLLRQRPTSVPTYVSYAGLTGLRSLMTTRGRGR